MEDTQDTQDNQDNQWGPRIPDTHINYLCETCYIECDKPYDPANQNYGDMALCCCPCALILDIICCIPLICGCYNITIPKK